MAAGGVAPVPIGREAEHAAAATFLAAAARGPAALVLTGPAGIGKTTLWRAILADAERRGYRTIATRAVEAEAKLAFAGLADLLDPWLDDALDGLPPAQRVALEVALQRVPAGGAEPPPLAVALGTLGALRALAARSPVVVAVDDLPWLDPPSARILEYAARRLGRAPIGLAVTVRRDEIDPVPLPIVVAVEGPVEQVHVGPLDLAEIDALVRAEFDLSLRRPALVWLQSESGGNPFVALELARVMQRTGARPGPGGLPVSAVPEDLVRRRLDALPPTTRVPLAAIAALGRPSVGAVVAAVGDAAAAIAAASDAGVVEVAEGRVRFAHPLLAAGAYGRLDEPARHELHARLAETADDPEARARHRALAVDEPSAAVAADLDVAARGAAARGSADAAADLEILAARLTPPGEPDAARARLMTAAEHLIRAGDPSRARSLLEAHVAAAPPGPGRADVLRVLADARSSDDWAAKSAILEQALAEAGDDHRLRSRILEALSQVRWHTARDARGQVELAMEAVREADAQDDPATCCAAYLTAVLARLNAGDGVAADLLDRATALSSAVERQRVYTWPAFCRALVDAQEDRLDEALEALRELQRRATAVGDWDSVPLLATNLAFVSFRRGAWQDAREHALEAERGSRQNGQVQGLALALANRALIEAALDEAASAQDAATEAVSLARDAGARATETEGHAALGLLALGAGDAAGASVAFARATDPWLAEGYRDAAVVRVVPDRAEALVALGRSDEAEGLLEPFEATARRLDRASALAATLRVRGLLAATRGDEDAAERAFAAALGEHGRVAEPFERARTLLALGETRRRFRRRGRARETLATALAVFEELGAAAWARRTAAELARTGHREAGSVLAPTELQVATLVAAGRTNREVAEELFMSVHTVEAHLTRIYRSLGVRSRTELARAMAARGDGGVVTPAR